MKIRELILYTQNLKRQYQFYKNILEFEIVGFSKEEFSVEVGSSLLTFKEDTESKPAHFALNIPSNKELEALDWLRKRVEILPFDSNELVDFNSWNAKAIYFYDIDNNIVEFISRKNLDIQSEQFFSSRSILNISEIGLPTIDMEKTLNQLNEIKTIPIYSGNLDRFCAVGNEEGMFIMVDPTKKKWFPKDDPILLADFELKGDFNFKYVKGEINFLKS